MTTSHAPTDITAEFYINGAWVNTISGISLSHRVRGTDDQGAIGISRGQSDQQAGVTAQTAGFTLNNRDGLFTDDNPLSPLYQQFGQSVRCRLGVQTGGTWDEYLRLPDYANTASGQYASTADKASLDITGDIDVRIEYSPLYTRYREMVLAGKWTNSGNQRSWILYTQPNGGFKFWWSSDGTGGGSQSVVTTPVIAESTTRLALRVTLDVDNGASGKVITFYTSTSITGSWTLFAQVTIATTTSIFASTADLEIGATDVGGLGFPTSDTFAGRVHAFELYNGIAGTKVADFKPVGKGLETTTWADTCASPNTWLINGSEARLASSRVRVSGELLTTPIAWDKTGADVTVPVTLAGALARYSANKGALNSCIYNYYRNNANVTDYWPCEDSAGATQAASAVDSGRAGQVFDVTFGSTSGIDGSAGSLTLNTALSSYAKFYVGREASATGATTCVFYFNASALPALTTTFATVYVNAGTVRQWRVAVDVSGFTFTLVDAAGATVATSNVLYGTGANPIGQWVAMSLRLTQESGNVRWETAWHAVGDTNFYTNAGGGLTFAGTCGQFDRVNFLLGDASLAGTQICHVVLTHGDDVINTVDFANVSAAYPGEAFGARAKRLCSQEGVHFQWRGDLSQTQAIGPQPIDTLYNILADGQKVAGGILTDSRDIIGFEYVTQRFLGNRRGLVLDYSQSHLADTPLPVTDTRYLVNDFTATRNSGSSARSEVTTGRKSTADPPNGIGRWQKSDTFNASSDSETQLLASRETFQGTWPERRIPNVNVMLSRSEIAGTSALLTRVIATDLGDPVTLTGLASSPLPPNDLLLTIFGYSETIAGFLWTIVANTVPAGPYQVPIIQDYAGREPRMDADDSTHTVLKANITSSATSFTVKTDASSARTVKAWVDATNYPADIGGGETIDVNIGGEQITLSSIAAPSLVSGFNEQVVTVSARSVNGIVKAHSTGDSMMLWQPFYLGME